MYNYDSQALEARQRQAEMLKQAEQEHLAAIVQGKSPSLRFIGWRLPVLHLSWFNRKPAANRSVPRRTASDNI